MATNDPIAPNDPASIVAVPNGNQSVTGIFSNQGNYGLQASNVSQTFTLPASLTVTSNFAVNGYNTPQSISSINPTFDTIKIPAPIMGVDPTPVTPQNAANSTQKSSTTPINDNNTYTDTGTFKVTPELIKKWEKQTNLNPNELKIIYTRFGCDGGEPNSSLRFLILQFLVKGFDWQVLSVALVKGQNGMVVDDNFIKKLLSMKNDPDCLKIIKKTPAWEKHSWDDLGATGVTHGVNASAQPVNPITGPKQFAPSLVTDLMEKIHPGSVKELETVCNKIRSHSWLAMPKGAFGSLGRLLNGINKVVESFEAMISNIYQGCIRVIQQVYARLNGILVSIQKKILGVINRIIPLDLLCLILDTVQVLLDDVNFFTSLFQMSGPFLNYLNTFQTYLNTTSQFVSNPLTTIMSYMPQNVQNIINTVNQIGADPNGFLADKLNNYGYNYVLQALQGNLLGAVVNKYGPSKAALPPLGNLLTKGTAIYSRFGGQWPTTAATLGPNIYTGQQTRNPVDVNGSPLSNLASIFKNQYDTTVDAISGNVAQFQSGLTDIGAGFSGIGTDINNFFHPPPKPAQ